MRKSFVFLFAALAAALIIAPAASAFTYYAAPGGSGFDCTAAACTAGYAVGTKAQDNDTVVFAGGDYVVNAALATNKWISLEGATAGVPTRFVGSAVPAYTLIHSATPTAQPAHITDIQLSNQTNTGIALLAFHAGTAGLTIDRVRAEAVYTAMELTQSSPGPGLVVRNSIGRSTGSNGTGIAIFGPDDDIGSAELRNVIGDSRGPSGVGIAISGNGNGATQCGIFNVVMKNSIARSADGPNSDLTFTQGVGAVACAASLVSQNSNWRGSTSVLPISSVNDQHTVDPLFVNAAAGDYHQAPGSPTIDAGTSDSLVGATDLDNLPRSVGPAPDIGAFEAPLPPDTLAPAGSSLKFKPKSFVPTGSKRASIAAQKKKKPKGTKVTFTLSEAATVAFTVEKKSSGRKKGKSCSTKAKTGKKCTIYKAVRGSFSRVSTLGANSFKFTGYVNRKALKPGSYRLVGVPIDAAGNAGKTFRATFTILNK